MKKDNLGNPISTATDEIDGQRWIVIRDSAGKEIMRVQKELWNNQNSIN